MKADMQASLWALVSCINVEAAEPRDGLGHMALLRSTGDLAKTHVPDALECFALYLRCNPNRNFADKVKERAAKCDDLEDLRSWLETQNRRRKAPPKKQKSTEAPEG